MTTKAERSTRPARSLLLVEDDPHIVRSIGPAFDVSGYSLTVATTGREAIEYLDCGRWDAVIVDLGLPDMDGKAVIAHLRDMANTPIIVISATDSRSDVEAARKSGANCFVHKPFRTPQLIGLLNEQISSAGSASFAEI